MSLTKYQCIGWRDIVKIAEEKYPGNSNLYAYAKEVIQIASSTKLTERDIIELTLSIGVKIYPRQNVFQNYLGNSKQIVTGLPSNWIPSLNKEIRFSARKPGSPFENCQKPYVTELVVAGANMKVETKNGLGRTQEKDEIWTMIDSSSNNHSFSTYNTRPEVHIDARLYDFDKLTLRLPICHCIT